MPGLIYRSLTAGSIIGHYKITALLGVGGMGEVYQAQDTNLEHPVALKILPEHLVEAGDRVRRFVQETKSASALNHLHIIAIYEIGQASPSQMIQVPQANRSGGNQLMAVLPNRSRNFKPTIFSVMPGQAMASS